MANSTKPGLTAVVTPAGTDLFSVRQSGDTRDKKETLTQVKSFVLVDLSVGAIVGGVIPVSVNAGASGANVGISFVPRGTGQCLFPAGSLTIPGIGFTGDPTRGISAAGGGIGFLIGGLNTVAIDGMGNFMCAAANQITWSASGPLTGGAVSGLIGNGAAVVKVTNGTNGIGQIQCDGTTGTGIPLFGSNSPASSLANPYTWLKFKAPDGTQVFAPAWA